MLRIRFVLSAAVALGLSATAAWPDAHLENAVKARQSQMTLYAFNLGVLGAMAKGTVPYDADAASKAANNIATLTTLDQSNLWPADSDNLSMEKTRALPDLWENMSDVGTKSGALSEAAMAMKAAAGTDLAALQAAMGGLGGACGACHKAYRQPD